MSVGSRYQDPLETWSEKFSRKFKENPWVPLGCLATCGALVMSAVKMRAGQSRSMNYWLRARVVLQGVTIVALVAGSMALQKHQISDSGIGATDDGLPRNEATTELSKERKRILEQQAFEERLKDAQAAAEQEQEQGVGMMIVKGPSLNKERQEGEKKKVVPVDTRQPDASSSQSPVFNEVKKSNGWGWWSSGKSSEQRPGVKSNDSDSMS